MKNEAREHIPIHLLSSDRLPFTVTKMAGPSPSSSHIIDCEEFEKTFIEKFFSDQRQKADVDQFSSWRSTFSLFRSCSATGSLASFPSSGDFLAPESFSEASPREAMTIWDADRLLERTSIPSPESHSLEDLEILSVGSLPKESPESDGSSQWAWPISQRGVTLNSPDGQSPIEDFFTMESSPEASSPGGITIWDADLYLEQSTTSSPQRQSCGSVALFTPTSADLLSRENFPSSPEVQGPEAPGNFRPTSVKALSWMKSDGFSASSEESEAIHIWEADLVSDLSSTHSSDIKPIDRTSSSGYSLGGFSFEAHAPSMENCSFGQQDQVRSSSQNRSLCSLDDLPVLSRGSSLQSWGESSAFGQGKSIFPMEDYTFDDKEWVQEFVVAMTEDYAGSSWERGAEMPVLLPSAPESSLAQKTSSIVNEGLQMGELLRQVSKQLSAIAAKDPAAVGQPSSRIPGPKPQRPKLKLTTNFLPDLSIVSSPERDTTDAEYYTPPESAQTPDDKFYTPPQSPFAMPGRLRRSTTRFAAESLREAYANQALLPRESYSTRPKPRKQRPKLTVITKFSLSGSAVYRSEIETPNTHLHTPPQSPPPKLQRSRQPSIRFAAEPSHPLCKTKVVYPKEAYPRSQAQKRHLVHLAESLQSPTNRLRGFADVSHRHTPRMVFMDAFWKAATTVLLGANLWVALRRGGEQM